jgi:hypothetical protein
MKETDNYGRPRSEYLAKIAAMSEAELMKETEQKAWLSAYAHNNRRSDYHWQHDACAGEWTARGRIDRYSEALERARQTMC